CSFLGDLPRLPGARRPLPYSLAAGLSSPWPHALAGAGRTRVKRAPARSGRPANPNSLTAHLQDVALRGVEAISPTAVRREPHRARALYPPPARRSRIS